MTPTSVSGVVYVPCAVNLTTAGRYNATIAAEGTITVTASSITVGPGNTQRGAVALVSGASGTSINLVGADSTVLGQTVGVGAVTAAGARTSLTCGAVGRTISIAGADSSATLGSWCMPG